LIPDRRQHPRIQIRPKDRYADGRESARVLLALANQTLTVAEIALKAAKDFDETRALVNALRRQGKVKVERREWRAVRYKGGHPRKRHVAVYHADNPSQLNTQSAHALGQDVSA
jgi:hypothetical protein